MNVNRIEDSFNSVIFARGREYYYKNKVKNFHTDGKGEFFAIVKGSKEYGVMVKIDMKTGNVKSYICSCPCDYPCKHLVALLMEVSEYMKENSASSGSSEYVFDLIKEYNERTRNLVVQNESTALKNSIKLVPCIAFHYRRLNFSMHISYMGGREFVVNDLSSIKHMFDINERKQYGKSLSLVHSYSGLDERSRKLLDFTERLVGYNGGYYTVKEEEISQYEFSDLLEIYNGDYISFNNSKLLVKCENPVVSFNLVQKSEDVFSLELDHKGRYEVIWTADFSVWYRKDEGVIYYPDQNFTNRTARLYNILKSNENIKITREDMPLFYSSVLKSVQKFCEIKNLDIIEECAPAEGTAQLYIDVDQSGDTVGKLLFTYDDKIFEAYSNKNDRLCDYEMEYAVENIVSDYFEHTSDPKHPLVVPDEDTLYRLCSEGLDRLMGNMEIFASERFKNFRIRPAARPVIGIKPESSLLQLEITEENYSAEELLELLNAYRSGVKYHRLKDGSFAEIDSGISELAELTNSLNITDKTFLKERISIPAYRMLYLDNLAGDTEALRIKRNKQFRTRVEEYRHMADDAENLHAPEHLDNIMRDYQKYGFRWLRTIANYKFGGVLADDMGLGKTLQAISLMADAKINSTEHRTNLVVCPASLTINWESEIKKFAPELSAAVVNGTANERKAVISETEKYDVIITSYSIISRDIAEYDGKHFYMQFIDEAQYIKNHSTQAAKAVKGIDSEVRYALTGTPVENSLAELWSIFDYIMPGYLFGYTSFKKSFETPIVKNKDSEAVVSLQKIVSPFILRRMKKEVLTELPEKTETILYSDMSTEQSKLYSANVLSIKNTLRESADEQEKLKILAMLTRLRQICCDPSIAFDDYEGGSGKLDLCCELVEECVNSGHKLLIFSQFTTMLDRIAERLNEMKISFFMLTGSTKPRERLNMVNKFNKDDTNVFLISLKAGGTGLNLTGADIVIHYDPWWNVSAENQASDRVYRIGQKRNVQIYKLITRGTIEEKICDLQKNKAELAELAVSGEGNIMRMSTDDIMSILG